MQRSEKSIRVRAPIDQIYATFRDFDSLAEIFDFIREVRPLTPDGHVSHWKVGRGLEEAAEFDVEIAEEERIRSIGWRSLTGNIGMSGNVTFAELDGEALVHVILQWYDASEALPNAEARA